MLFQPPLKKLLFACSLITCFCLNTAFANTWTDLNENQDYTERHEMSFVQAGDKFYSFGGRENPQTLDIYDFNSDTWSRGAEVPKPFNHFQATEYEGLIWVIGSFQNNNFPNETPETNIFVYDPAADFWIEGMEIPVNRRRGSAGLAIHEGKFYVLGGNTIGHNGGFVSWFDVYDPRTGEWTVLEDAPNARDHFAATVANNKLYAAGGRLSGGVGGTFAPLIAGVDVYDFATSSWSTLPSSSDLPTPRAGTSSVTFQNRVIVIGGEGNGQAYDTVEELNPNTNQWTTLDSLNFARHGTQAIVSGNGIFIAGGSPRQGGGRQRNMEGFNSTTPVGDESSNGILISKSEIVVTNLNPYNYKLLHVHGNQGVMVSNIEFTGGDANLFDLSHNFNFPILVGIDDLLTASFTASSLVDGAESILTITLASGETQEVQIRMDIDPPCPPDDPNQYLTNVATLRVGCFVN